MVCSRTILLPSRPRLPVSRSWPASRHGCPPTVPHGSTRWSRCGMNEARSHLPFKTEGGSDATSDSCNLPLELTDIDLLHPQQGLHRACCSCGIVILEQLGQHGRYDLPGESVLVLQPAALLRPRVSAAGELVPVVVDLLLRFAVDLQRHCFVERENGSPVESRERLAVELEAYRHDGTGWPVMDLLSRFSGSSDADDPGVLEH